MMPTFNPFNVGKNAAALFEIRLESDFIVLRGPQDEASSKILRGVVVLCLSSALKVEDVHLRMTGQSKVGWSDPTIHKPPIGLDGRLEKVEEIFIYKWPPFVCGEGTGSSSKSITLEAANYEWPFEIVIPGSMSETVEGLDDVHVIYKLKATVSRGLLSHNLHAYKHVRIVRTLDPAALEFAHTMTIENEWPNKVQYLLQIPQKAVIFGTGIQIELKFTPLIKGLTIGKISCTLIEFHDWAIFVHSIEKRNRKLREIATWSFEMNEADHYQDVMDESGQDGWVLKKTLPVPKSLKLCMQDVQTPGIKIRHRVKFVVALKNPDGHTSELRANLPVMIFISPNMPIDDSGNLLDQAPGSSLSIDVDAHAPPVYGHHILDQLYADIDSSGFRTPALRSGMATPIYSHSRSGSTENVSSTEGGDDTEVRPDALSSRLQNISVAFSSSSRNNSSFFRRGNRTASGDNSPLRHDRSFDNLPDENALQRGSPLASRTSEENAENQASGVSTGRHTPEHIDYSDMDLSKVPSYTTALRSPARGMSYSEAQALPNYETAVSASPSPLGGRSSLATVATVPVAAIPVAAIPVAVPATAVPAAEVPVAEVNENNNVSEGRPWNALAGMGLTVHRSHSQTIDSDAQRIFQVFRTRGMVH